MQQTTRLFIAAPVPDELKLYLSQQASLYQDAAIRQVPEANLHLTLFFIGNVPAERQDPIQEVTEHIASQFPSFELQLEAIEPGPKPRSPRLIWARFAQNDTFAQLSRSLTQALSDAKAADRAPLPHITLARFRKDRPAPRNLETQPPETALVLPVQEIAVWHSELASPHPRYSILHTYPLLGNPAEVNAV